MADSYRINGPLRWSSQSGNAIIALQNAAGSNKKITINSFEVMPLWRAGNAGSTGTTAIECAVIRCSALSEAGKELPAAKMDTNAASLPSQVKLYEKSLPVESGRFRKIQMQKLYRPDVTALCDLIRHTNRGAISGRASRMLSGNSQDIEQVIAREGEGIAITTPFVDRGIPLRVEATFKVGSSTYKTLHFLFAGQEDLAIWGIFNGAGSGVTVQLIEFCVDEVGDPTTPYFQLVPIGSIAPERLGDLDSQVTVVKYDSSNPTLTSSQLIVATDAPCLPASGIPQVAISDASAGTPRGVNYLNTKDFIGPLYRAFFAEMNAFSRETNTDTKGLTTKHDGSRLIDHFSPIVLRPGEAMGLVSSAELATATTAVPQSGQFPFDIGIDLIVEDIITPTITLTGLPANTRVCFVEQNTETLVTIGTSSGGTFSYSGFAANPGSFFDIRILCAGYVFQQLNDIEKLSAVQTIPVSLEADLVYDAAASEGITFSGSTKRIVCDSGNTNLNVPYVYSEWVDWAIIDNNLAYFHAFENQGGSDIDISAGTSIPKYCYLVNSWRIRPQEANHTLTVADGIILVDGGGDPFVNTLSAYTVRINYQQPVQAIAVATGGGGGSGDWTTTEKEQIRDRLGIDGSASAASATPSLATADAVADVKKNTDLIPATL